MSIKSDIASYVPKSQWVIDKIDQFSGEPTNDYAKYVDGDNNVIKNSQAILTSWGDKYTVVLEDLKKGNFANALKIFDNVNSNPGANMIQPGLKNKSPELFYYAKPTEDDYVQGTFRRYFLQDVRNGEIKEINADTYKTIGDKAYYRRVKLEWNIVGPSEDQTVNGYVYPGAEARNRDVVSQAEETITGITDFLKDLRQFVVEEPSKFRDLKKQNSESTQITRTRPGTTPTVEDNKKVIQPEELPQAPPVPTSVAGEGASAVQESTQSVDSTNTYAKSLIWYQAQVGNPSPTRICGTFNPVSMKIYNQVEDLFDENGNPKKDVVYYRTKNAENGNIYMPPRVVADISMNPKQPPKESYDLYYTIKIEGYGTFTAKIDRQGKLYDIERC